MANQEVMNQDASNLKLNLKYKMNLLIIMVVMMPFALLIDQKLSFHFLEYKKNVLQIINK